MKNWISKAVKSLWICSGVVCLSSSALGKGAPDRVILFIIDGLATTAPERIAMPHFNELKKKGVYYKEMYLPPAGHPERGPDYPWSCSLPNPMLMSGTPFVGREGIRKSMIQYSFEPKEAAFIVNARSYFDLSEGFGTYIPKPKNPDSLVIDITTEKMKEQDFAFMRVHLQRTGIEGMKVGWEKHSDKPYYQNIWHEKSRYRDALTLADKQLGRLVAWLKAENLWKGTVLMVCGDHGQADKGWHEPYTPASSITPLLIAGAGVTGPSNYEYCEIFDIAPTITYVMGKETPALSLGRVLLEAFDPGVEKPKVAQSVKRHNKALLAAHALPDAQKATLSEKGFMTLDQLGKWHTTEAGTDFEKFVSQQEAILSSLEK